MKVKFQDFYGQHITVHNETSNGNVRIKIKTFPNMNDLAGVEEDSCPLDVDIALDAYLLKILIGALQKIEEGIYQ